MKRNITLAAAALLVIGVLGVWYFTGASAPVVANSDSKVFSVLPTSGSAPLTITFTYHGTVQEGRDYRVSFDDGENVSLGKGDCNGVDTCTQDFSASHTYRASGTYVVTLEESHRGTTPGSEGAIEGTFSEALDSMTITVK